MKQNYDKVIVVDFDNTLAYTDKGNIIHAI